MKWYYQILLAALLLLFAYMIGCNKGRKDCIEKVVIKNDTIVHHDTFTHKYYVPSYKVILKDTGSVRYRVDTVENKSTCCNELYYIDDLLNEANNALNEKAFYSDTQHLKNGVIIISDTVAKNRISSRSIQVDLKDSLITKTVFIQPKENVKAYLNIKFAVNNLAAGLLFKFNNGLQAGFSYNTNYNKGFWAVDVAVPLKLKK